MYWDGPLISFFEMVFDWSILTPPGPDWRYLLCLEQFFYHHSSAALCSLLAAVQEQGRPQLVQFPPSCRHFSQRHRPSFLCGDSSHFCRFLLTATVRVVKAQRRNPILHRAAVEKKESIGLGRVIICPSVKRLRIKIYTCVYTRQVLIEYQVPVEFIISHVKITSK
jgi:hypothetical protein